MAFNNVGALVALNPGQSVLWSYSYGGDHGTQMATADVKIPNLGAVHRAFDQKKQKFSNGTTCSRRSRESPLETGIGRRRSTRGVLHTAFRSCC